MDDNMIKSLRRRVEDADDAHRQAQIRTSMACLHIHNECDGSFAQSEAEGQDEREKADGQQQKHAGVATEHSIIAQNNQLQLQLEASFRRTKLLERRLQERQVSPASSLCMCIFARDDHAITFSRQTHHSAEEGHS
jgi:hypothetical protein